jgi:hypothetical protein
MPPSVVCWSNTLPPDTRARQVGTWVNARGGERVDACVSEQSIFDRFGHIRGITKLTPSLAPPLERIDVLMPINSPFIFTSAPPKLPGLIEAAVC